METTTTTQPNSTTNKLIDYDNMEEEEEDLYGVPTADTNSATTKPTTMAPTRPTATNGATTNQSMTSLSAAASAGPTLNNNSAGVGAKPICGYICHLLAKTPVDPKVTFELQPSTRALMQLIKQQDPKATFLNQSDGQVNSDDEIGATTAEYEQYATYKYDRLHGRLQHQVFFSVRLSIPFSRLKSPDGIAALIKLNIFVELKAFRSTEYLIVGWLARVHPILTWMEDLQNDLTLVANSIVGDTAPPFGVIKRPRRFGNEARTDSWVFDIECDKKDEATLMDIFIDQRFVQMTGALFVPATMIRNDGPEVYSAVLRAHTTFCNRIETIPIYGLKLELVHLQNKDGVKPVHDTLVNFSDGTKLHRTALTEENGKFLLAFPKDKRERALARINEALALIKDQDFAKTEPQWLFDGRLPRTGHPPRTYANKKLNSYTTDLCPQLEASVSATPTLAPNKPVLITLNRGRRYDGKQSPSFRSMVTGPTADTASNSTLSNVTDRAKSDKVETELEALRQKLEGVILEQRKANEVQRIINEKTDARLGTMQSQCVAAVSSAIATQFQTISNSISNQIDTKLDDKLDTRFDNLFDRLTRSDNKRNRDSAPPSPIDNSEKRRRDLRLPNNNNTISASPSNSQAAGTSESAMEEAAT